MCYSVEEEQNTRQSKNKTMTNALIKITASVYKYPFSNCNIKVSKYGSVWKVKQFFPTGKDADILFQGKTLKACKEWLSQTIPI